eukprot:ANDGO_06715.mRNA.1 hypothetical protein
MALRTPSRSTKLPIPIQHLPYYACAWLTPSVFVVGGGGGRSRTGVPNGLRVYEAVDFPEDAERPSHSFPLMDSRLVASFDTASDPVESIGTFGDSLIVYSTATSVGVLELKNQQLSETAKMVFVQLTDEQMDAMQDIPKIQCRVFLCPWTKEPRIVCWTNVKRDMTLASPSSPAAKTAAGIKSPGRTGAASGGIPNLRMWFARVSNLSLCCVGNDEKTEPGMFRELWFAKEVIDVDIRSNWLCVTSRDSFVRIFDLFTGNQVHCTSNAQVFSSTHRLIGAKFMPAKGFKGYDPDEIPEDDELIALSRSKESSGKAGRDQTPGLPRTAAIHGCVVVCAVSSKGCGDVAILSGDLSRVELRSRKLTRTTPSSFRVEKTHAWGCVIGTVEGEVVDVRFPDLQAVMMARRHSYIATSGDIIFEKDRSMVLSVSNDSSLQVHRAPRLAISRKNHEWSQVSIIACTIVVVLLAIFVELVFRRFARQ